MDSPDYSMVEHTGTTILAIKCVDGVVMASDSRSTIGNFVSSRISNKITKVGNNVFVSRTGTTAHTQALSRFAKFGLGITNLFSDNGPNREVSIIAHQLQRMIQSNKDLSAAFICAGYDDEGPQVWEIAVSGMAIPRNFAANGSGSAYITAYCDDALKDDMTIEEATKVAIDAVTNAIIRDGASGGFVNVVQITANGNKRIIVKPKDQRFNYTIVKS